MIKFIGPEIAAPLSHIFNLSLRSGVFPNKLKQARVIPIFKSGDHLDCDNYRPISLLSSISKILEKIVSEKLIYHLIENDLLYQHQYGFLPKRSTEHNLMQILNYVTKALNENMFCIGIFLDLRKAFDVCSHEILLKKLKKMGIRGTTFEWFKNYLLGRTQKVDINGHLSDACELSISVIQGSILGPILFLCYINDFWKCTTLFSVLFADDTACLAKGKTVAPLIDYANAELKKIANWFLANKMAVNTVKTKFIIFRTRGKVINNEECNLVFNSNEVGMPEDQSLIFPIERIYNEGAVTSFKLLGVLFDEFLSFDEHVSGICKKLSKSLFCISRVKNFVKKESLLMLYYAMIHPHINYCLNIYSCANKTTLNKLRLKQKEAIRIVSNSGYRDHTEPLFRRLNVLPLDKLISFSALNFMHSFKFNILPISFAETWVTNRMRNPERNLRNAEDFYIPSHNYATLKRLPLFTFPKVWNDLDNQNKLNPVPHLFLKHLKLALISTLNE